MYRKKRYSKIENFIDTEEQESSFKLNRAPLYILICIVFLVLFVNLFNMQIVLGKDYLSASNLNYKNQNIVRAPRGLIFDSNGTRLAFNENQYLVYIDPIEFDEDKYVRDVANILSLTEKDIKDKIENEQVYGRATIKKGIAHSEYLSISSKIKDIPGIYTEVSVGRVYIDPFIYSHILGYVGDPGEEDLSDRIDAHSQIGKTGLEQEFDSEIRGFDGVQINEVEISTGESKTYIPRSSEPGNNLILNLDNSWQSLAYTVLKDKVTATRGLGGAFTIMDIETGELKVLASYPGIDVNEFSKGISVESYEKLLKDPSSPLLERNVSVALPTGSIFKIITGAIALQVGVIDINTKYFSDGCMTLPGDQEFCESFFRKLGDVDIYRAIKLSSNIYFCNVSLEFEKNFGGIDIFKNYASEFSVGKITGIDLPGESAGLLPSPEIKNRLLGEPWFSGDLCNTAIGQGLLSATPLQMLVATASIENGGKVLKPQLVKKIEDKDGKVIKEFKPEIRQELSVSDENLKIISEAMRKAVVDYDGTVRKLSTLDFYVTGKTGTATAPVRINGVLYNQPHAWVVGIFEHNGHKYAYTVNIAHGGWGEETVDVVKRFLEGI